MSMQDNQGKEIQPGSYFVYSVRDGNSSAMRVGLILELDSKYERGVKCILARQKWNGDKPRSWEVIERPQWLGTLDNLIAVRRDMLDRDLVFKLDARRSEVG